LREVAKKVPLDRILVETDAPYLTPVPYRGKPNSPAYTYYTAEKLAVTSSPLSSYKILSVNNFLRLSEVLFGFDSATRIGGMRTTSSICNL
jgi:TatD DNase family protein